MVEKVTFNKDAIGQVQALNSDTPVYTFQRGRSTYEINKIHIYDKGEKVVCFNAGRLLDDAGRNEKGRYEGIQFPYELKVKHKVDFSQKEAFCISRGRNQGVLIADLFIPKDALEDFREKTIVKENNVGKFFHIYVEFNGFRILLRFNYKYDLEKIKLKANKNINELLKAINEAKTLQELNRISSEFELRLYC